MIFSTAVWNTLQEDGMHHSSTAGFLCVFVCVVQDMEFVALVLPMLVAGLTPDKVQAQWKALKGSAPQISTVVDICQYVLTQLRGYVAAHQTHL
jgi:hypothetical protein